MLPYPAVPLLLLLQEAALKAVEAPLLFLCAESDFTFGPKVRTRAQELLEEKSPGESLCTVTACATHGRYACATKQQVCALCGWVSPWAVVMVCALHGWCPVCHEGIIQHMPHVCVTCFEDM
jgi:hypothetical protein